MGKLAAAFGLVLLLVASGCATFRVDPSLLPEQLPDSIAGLGIPEVTTASHRFRGQATFEAPPEEVFSHFKYPIQHPENLPKRAKLTVDNSGNQLKDDEWGVGSVMHLEFRPALAFRKTNVTITQIAAEPNTLLADRIVVEQPGMVVECVMIFELQPISGGTQLTWTYFGSTDSPILFEPLYYWQMNLLAKRVTDDLARRFNSKRASLSEFDATPTHE